MKDTDLAWLAGLLEGEGSFMMGRNTVRGKVYLYPKVVVTMTDEDVILRAAELFGTGVYVVPNKRPVDRLQQYRTQVSGVKAANLMEQLIPHMGSRRTQKISEILFAYGEIETTESRRVKACSDAAKARWDLHGTRNGRLPT